MYHIRVFLGTVLKRLVDSSDLKHTLRQQGRECRPVVHTLQRSLRQVCKPEQCDYAKFLLFSRGADRTSSANNEGYTLI